MSTETDTLLEQLKEFEGTAVEAAPTGMKVKEERTIEITVGKLRPAIEANPHHPVGVSFAKGIRNFGPQEVIYVGRVDLQCLLENKEVEVTEEKREVAGKTSTYIVKKIGKSLSSKPSSKLTKAPISISKGRKTTINPNEE